MTYRSVGDGAPSLWLSRRHLLREVECAVVGGGWVGLSTAYWLARQGKETVVLEAESLAARASGRNAGFLLTGSAEPFTRLVAQVGKERALAFWRLTSENRELVRSELLDRELLDRDRVDCDRLDCEFLPEGSWIAAAEGASHDPGGEKKLVDKVEELRRSAEILAAEGLDLEWIEGDALRRASGSERLGGAIFQPHDGGLDPVALARGVAALGTFDVLAGARVDALKLEEALTTEGDRIRLHTAAGDLLAERVVLALNAYAPHLIPQLAADVRPVRGQILSTEPGPRPLKGVWYIDDGFQYLRQLSDGTVLLGGCRNAAFDEEVGYLETPTAAVQGALEAFLTEFFPHLAGRPVRHRWAGIMAFTPDGFPVIGEIPHLPGSLYAAGGNGHGMSLGFVLGRYLARRVCGEEVGEFLPGE